MRSGALVTALLLCLAAPARAVDSVSFEIGRGSDHTDLWRVGAQWRWAKSWFSNAHRRLGGYWDLQAGEWRNETGRHIRDISLTPVFRLQWESAVASPYLEAAIGFHILSSTDISSSRRFGSHVQFGDHIGAGIRYGERGHYDTSVRLQHLSNAGLAHPNPGINFLQLRFQYHFD